MFSDVFMVGLDFLICYSYQVGLGQATLETYKTEVQKQTVAPHGVWKISLQSGSLKPWKRGKSTMVENTLQIRVFLSVSNVISRIRRGLKTQ